MPQKIIKFRDKRSGKIYEMPWDDEAGSPTPLDLDKFADRQDNPTFGDKIGSFFGGMSDIPKSLYNTANEMGKKGATHLMEGDLPGAFHDIAGFITDPFTPQTPLLQPKMSPEAARTEGKKQLTGLAGLPVDEFQEALGKSDYPRVAGQVTGAGLALLAPHAIGRFGARGGSGLGSERPLPKVEDITGKARAYPVPYPGDKTLGEGKVRTGPQPLVPENRRLPPVPEPVPEPEPPPQGQLTDAGLDPRLLESGTDADRTFYGGSRGTVSENIDEPATRTFRGGAGLASPTKRPIRNWMDALRRVEEMKNEPEMSEVPGPNRDILPPMSPFARRFSRGRGLPPVVEGEVLPEPKVQTPTEPTEIPSVTGDVGSQIPDVKAKAQEVPKAKRPFENVDDDSVEVFAHTGDQEAILEATRRPNLRSKMADFLKNHFQGATKSGPLLKNPTLYDNLPPKSRDYIVKTWMEKYKPKQAAKAEIAQKKLKPPTDRTFHQVIRDLFGEKVPDKLKEFMDKFKEETGAIGPDLEAGLKAKKAKAREKVETPPSDMFDESNPELDSSDFTEPFSHESFLSDLKSSLKATGKKLKGQKGMLAFGSSAKEKLLKKGTKEWIFRRNAAEEYGKMAEEDATSGGPKEAQRILGQMWNEQKAAFITPEASTDSSPAGVRKYVRAAKVRIANSHFKQLLENEGLLKPNRRVDTATDEGKMVQEWIQNHTRPAGRISKTISDLAGWSKNIYLAGGVPGTPLNIHGYNIARSDMMARGYLKGAKSFYEGVFHPSVDKAVFKKYRRLLPEAIENGFIWHDIEDTGGGHGTPVPLKNLAEKVPFGKAGVKGVEKVQGWFEDALFKRYLPARKLEFLGETVGRFMREGQSRRDALSSASKLANDYFGGVEKVLRDRTMNNIGKAVVLAPDWFESRMKLGYKGVKGALKSITGNATSEDRIYMKGLGRALGMRLAREGVIIAGLMVGGKKAKDYWDSYTEPKGGDVTSIPLGKTSGGPAPRNRMVPTLGTAAEVPRLTEEGLNKMFEQKDPGVIFNLLENRLSQPAQSVGHLLFNVDPFGNPVHGQGKFGKPIGFGKSGANIGLEATRSLQPQQLQAIFDYMGGRVGGEEAIAKGMEAPLKYSSTRTFGQIRRRRSRR